MIKKCFILLVVISFSAAATWLATMSVFQRQQSDYLKTAIFHYMKQMSDAGMSEFADFEDCLVHQSSESEMWEGVSWSGICRADTSTGFVDFTISMNHLAQIVSSEFEL